MRNITYILDSGSDFEEYLQEKFSYPIKVVPLHINIDGVDYLDGVDITKTDFYTMLENAIVLPKTSQPTPNNFYTVFKEEVEKGNEILYIGISGKLSGTIQSAMLAKQMLDDEQQDKIHIVDSESISAGIVLQLFEADRLLANGATIPEVIEKLEKYKKQIRIDALLDTLENLKKGGRLSTTSAVIGGLLNIKPFVSVENGLIEAKDKFRGRKKGLKHLYSIIDNPKIQLDSSRIFIAHSVADEEQLKEELSELDLSQFNDVLYIKLGSIIGTYAGNNTLGLVYIEK